MGAPYFKCPFTPGNLAQFRLFQSRDPVQSREPGFAGKNSVTQSETVVEEHSLRPLSLWEKKEVRALSMQVLAILEHALHHLKTLRPAILADALPAPFLSPLRRLEKLVSKLGQEKISIRLEKLPISSEKTSAPILTSSLYFRATGEIKLYAIPGQEMPDRLLDLIHELWHLTQHHPEFSSVQDPRTAEESWALDREARIFSIYILQLAVSSKLLENVPLHTRLDWAEEFADIRDKDSERYRCLDYTYQMDFCDEQQTRSGEKIRPIQDAFCVQTQLPAPKVPLTYKHTMKSLP